MKVLFVYQFCTVGGVETSIKNRLLALDYKKEDVSFDLLFYQNFGGDKIFQNLECQVYIENDENEISNIVKGYDIIISIDDEKILQILENVNYKGKIVLEVHTTYKEGLQYLKRINTDMVNMVLVPSNYSKTLVEEYFDADKINVLYNAIDSETFGVTKIQCESSKPTLLWVGRIDTHKNVCLFLDLCREINNKTNGMYEFWVVGGLHSDKQLIETFKNKIFENGLYRSVRWLPFVETSQMKKVYNYAACTKGAYILTSKNESFGMTVIEAMKCGCPVIGNGVGAIPELINEETGLLLDCQKNVDILAESIMSHLEDKNRLSKMVKKGLKTVNEKFSSRVISDRFIKLMKKLE